MEPEKIEKTDENAQIPDRIAEIAQKKMEEINKSKEAKAKETSEKKEESKDASSESSPEKEKIEEPKKEEAKEPDMKSKEPETEVEKVKKSMQARIDELSGKFKATEAARKKDSEEIANLQKKIADLQEVTKESEEDIYERIIEEDKDKPLEKRREMSESDLEEFLLDDYSKATQWIIKRDMRREKESGKEEKPKEKTQDVDSTQELIDKYPKINVTARAAELAKEGKSDEEITKTMRAENKDFDLMMEIIESDPDKYADRVTGPRLVLDEMNKRSTNEVKTYTAEELEAAKKEAAEMERKRIESIDVGRSSNFRGPVSANNTNDPNYKEGLDLYLRSMKKAGYSKTEKDYQARLKAREQIPGANNYRD